MRLARLLPLSLALLGAASQAEPVRAQTFSATTTTIVRGFDLLHGGRPASGLIDRVRTYRPVDQLARVSWDELGPRRAWTFDSQVRLRFDLATGRYGGAYDPYAGTHSYEDDEDFDVLLLEAGWRSKQGLVDLHLGRQQSITGFGWHAFDGVRLDFPKLDRLRVFTYAGLPVELGAK
jgi:hypothetical protein